jgi:hypothetical protein
MTVQRIWLLSIAMALLVLATGSRAQTAYQNTYASPEEAVTALVQAVKAHDRSAILATLGKASTWIGSGDPVADRAIGDRFVAAYDAKHSIGMTGDTATLVLGNDDYPFAFPIVKKGDRWRFDTDAGKEEMLARRIGQNELDAIKVLQAIVDAQFEYASKDRNGEGKHDGLYWPTKEGEPPSPLGPLVSRAAGEGYKSKESGPTPYRGYYYRLLKGQGKGAQSGALDYVVHGRAIGGFAVVAYPAKYGSSGIMTFIVNQDRKVYQEDLGPSTGARAGAMRRFEPGEGWEPVTGH